MNTTLTGGSLFTGVCGLDRAVEAVLGEVSWSWCSDIKPAAVTWLAHRRPGVRNVGDLTLLDVSGPDPRDLSPVDVLTFGWPCQSFSAAGRRLGEADPRALWPHVHRIIAALRPAILFGENVSRVASVGELRRVVRSLAEVGYVGAWRCLRASDVGAPHRRERLFLVAVRVDADRSAADTLGQLLRDEPGRSGGPNGAGAGVAGDDGPAGTAGDPGGLTLLSTPTRRDHKGAAPNRTGVRLDNGRTRGIGDLDLPGAINTLSKTPTANLGGNGGTQHPDKRKAGGHGPTLADEVEWLLPPGAGQRWGVYAQAVSRWEDALGRSAPSAVIASPLPGRKPILNPAFVEWMMGLPQGWVTDVPGLSRSQMLSVLGDGVVPQQAAHAYALLLDDLRTVTAGGVAA